MILNISALDALPKSPQAGSLYYRHPEYEQRWWWREFNRVSYVGGREYYRPVRLSIEFWEPNPTGQRDDQGRATYTTTKTAERSLLFRHNREKSYEFENRKKRAHYFNVVRTAVNSLVSHATKRGVVRGDQPGTEKATKVDPALEEYWNAVDYKRETSIDAFMRYGLCWAQVYGMMWAVTDVSQAEGDGKPYTYWVSPLDVFDWSTDADGNIEWLKQFVYAEGERTPMQAIRPMHRFRIWYKDRIEEWDVDPSSGAETKSTTRPNATGKVPLDPLFSLRNEECTFPDGESLVADFCKGANSVYNYVSLVNELAYKQLFSWLVIPDKNVDEVQIGTSTVFGYDPQGTSGGPEWISPDPEITRVLLELIGVTLEQMRSSIGIGRGRSESSKDQASGDALELESEDKRSILGDIASNAEDFEKRLARRVLSYKRTDATNEDLPPIQYPSDFDIRTFQSEINECLSLDKLPLSPEIKLALLRKLMASKFSGMPPEDLAALLDTLKAHLAELATIDKENRISQGPNGKPNQPGAGPPTGGAKKPGAATAADDAG